MTGYYIKKIRAFITLSQEVVIMEDDDSEFFKGMGAGYGANCS